MQAGCGDGCSKPPPWQEDPYAWQWDGQLGLVAAFAILLVAGVHQALRGRQIVGGGLIASAVTAFVVWEAAVAQNVGI